MSILDDKHVSLDIEACGEVLMSIGAVEFDPRTGESGPHFYCVPSIKEQLDVGLKMDASAFLWWLKQDDAARAAVQTQEPAGMACARFGLWCDRDAWVWAYPTSFDLPVIARVFAAFNVQVPWKWTRTMDGRTLWRLACAIDPAMEKIEKEANPAPHHAMEDAKEQAKWYAKYLGAVKP